MTCSPRWTPSAPPRRSGFSRDRRPPCARHACGAMCGVLGGTIAVVAAEAAPTGGRGLGGLGAAGSRSSVSPMGAGRPAGWPASRRSGFSRDRRPPCARHACGAMCGVLGGTIAVVAAEAAPTGGRGLGGLGAAGSRSSVSPMGAGRPAGWPALRRSGFSRDRTPPPARHAPGAMCGVLGGAMAVVAAEAAPTGGQSISGGVQTKGDGGS